MKLNIFGVEEVTKGWKAGEELGCCGRAKNAEVLCIEGLSFYTAWSWEIGKKVYGEGEKMRARSRCPDRFRVVSYRAWRARASAGP